jgi:cell division inhibitor SepF
MASRRQKRLSDKSLWRKILDFFGFDSDDDDEEMERDEAVLQEQPVETPSNKRPQQIVDLRQRQQFRVVVLQPRTFEDVPSMVEHVKVGRPVILNLDICDTKCRQRVLDFISGATYGSGGKIQKISEWIFLSAPANVNIDNISGELYEEEGTGRKTSLKKGD